MKSSKRWELKLYWAPMSGVHPKIHARKTNRVNQIFGFILRCYKLAFTFWIGQS